MLGNLEQGFYCYNRETPKSKWPVWSVWYYVGQFKGKVRKGYILYNFVLRLSSTRAVKEMYYRSSMRLCSTQCIKINVKWWKSKKKFSPPQPARNNGKKTRVTAITSRDLASFVFDPQIRGLHLKWDTRLNLIYWHPQISLYYTMKEFEKIITKKEEINFSIKEETNGQFVYVPFKENSDHIPGKLSFICFINFIY